MDAWLDPLSAALARLEGQQTDNSQHLLHGVEARVLRDAHARLAALLELVVLLDLDIECSAALEVGVTGLAVVVQPQVAGLQVGAVLAAGAEEG